MKKMVCRCGGTVQSQKAFVEGFLLDAHVCGKCGDVGLSLEAAKELLRLREESRRMNTTRKIVRIGNSIGVTLPQDGGFREGQTVAVELIGEGILSIKRKE